jgi:hypothetical protein
MGEITLARQAGEREEINITVGQNLESLGKPESGTSSIVCVVVNG